MRRPQQIWWKAAGLLLVGGPALAQGVPGTLPATASVNVPGSPACGAYAPADEGHWAAWQQWRAKKHADCQTHLWGYPQEFESPPLGAIMHAHFRVMVANGEAASMVLYRYDFVDGADTLNLHGRDRLTKIACMMAQNTFPIIIERTPEAPAVAEKRRNAILNILSMNNISVSPERVIIGPSIAVGLSGVEAERINFLMMDNVRVQGAAVPIPAGGGSVGTGAVGPGSIGTGSGLGTGTGR